MSIILNQKRNWLVKPAVSTQINWGHPIAEGLNLSILYNEGGGTPRNFINGLATTVTSNFGLPKWVATQYGVARQTGFPSSSQAFDQIAQSTLVTAGGTAFTHHIVFQVSAVATEHCLSCIGNTLNDGSSAFSVVTGHTASKLGYFVFSAFTDTQTVVANTWYHVVVTWNGVHTSGTVITYFNGQKDTTITATAAGNTNVLFLGAGFASGAAGDTATILMCNQWKRALTAVEVEQLYIDPFAFMQPQAVRRIWVVPAAVVSSQQQLALMGCGA